MWLEFAIQTLAPAPGSDDPSVLEIDLSCSQAEIVHLKDFRGCTAKYNVLRVERHGQVWHLLYRCTTRRVVVAFNGGLRSPNIILTKDELRCLEADDRTMVNQMIIEIIAKIETHPPLHQTA